MRKRAANRVEAVESDGEFQEPTGDVEKKQTAQGKVQASESKVRKVLVRACFGWLMIGMFSIITWAGPVYVCCLVLGIQALVFREMVNVRYIAAKEKEVATNNIAWSWFVLAVFYTYGDFLHEFVISHSQLLWMSYFTKWHAGISFSMYCVVFVTSVLTLKPGLYRYQVGQLTWTIVTICMIVAQLKFVAQNIFSGLFWFFFPSSLVVCNDVFAYFCGMSLGRKIVHIPFLQISPNKTWEGFIGASFFTALYAFFASGALAEVPWFTCPVESLTIYPHQLDACEPPSVFTAQAVEIPAAVLDFIHNFLLIDITGTITSLPVKPIQLHAVVMALFTSIIAPFGGFWASAIKRTYGIKDFDSIIPGHGGVTDRMDCQFITALFTSVYLRSFIQPSIVTVGKLVSLASLLTLQEQKGLLSELQALIADQQ